MYKGCRWEVRSGEKEEVEGRRKKGEWRRPKRVGAARFPDIRFIR